MRRRYTLKENLASVAIGIAIGVPLSLVSLHCQNKKMQEELEARRQIIEEQKAEEASWEEIPMEKASTELTSQAPTTTAASAPSPAPFEDVIGTGEYDELAILVQAEAGNQDQIGKQLVVDVVLNRVESEDFPDTIHEVINQKYQFSTVWDGAWERAEKNVTESDHEAVAAELEERLDDRILFFTAGGYGQYGTHAYQHGDHYFCYQ
jgi:spore germination cell wall hydrolase CwlJ-like protein